MTSLIAIGAGIAALTGIGAGVGIGIATGKAVQHLRQQTLSQDSRKQTERLQKHYYLVVHLPKVLQFSVWLLQF